MVTTLVRGQDGGHHPPLADRQRQLTQADHKREERLGKGQGDSIFCWVRSEGRRRTGKAGSSLNSRWVSLFKLRGWKGQGSPPWVLKLVITTTTTVPGLGLNPGPPAQAGAALPLSCTPGHHLNPFNERKRQELLSSLIYSQGN